MVEEALSFSRLPAADQAKVLEAMAANPDLLRAVYIAAMSGEDVLAVGAMIAYKVTYNIDYLHFPDLNSSENLKTGQLPH